MERPRRGHGDCVNAAPATAARPVEPAPGPPSPDEVPLDPDLPVPDDPGPLHEPDVLPPPPLEPAPDVLPTPEPV